MQKDFIVILTHIATKRTMALFVHKKQRFPLRFNHSISADKNEIKMKNTSQ